MKKLIIGVFVLLVTIVGLSERSHALILFDDRAVFLTATGATSATGPIPNLGSVGLGPVLIGSVGFDAAAGVVGLGLTFSDFSTLLPGNELAISGVENFNAVLKVPVFSLGFDFAEAEQDNSLNGPFVDSTFTVNLLSGMSLVDSFSFARPNDIETFVGVWSDIPFTKVEIREVVGDIGNELFGEFYTGTSSPSAVPTASTFLLLVPGLFGLVCFRLKRRKRSSV